MVALQQIVIYNMEYFTKTGLSLAKLYFCGIPHERIGSNIVNENYAGANIAAAITPHNGTNPQ